MPAIACRRLVVVAVDGPGSRPDVVRLGPVLRRLTRQALGGAGIDDWGLGRTPDGDGLVVSCPRDTPVEALATEFVDALDDEVAAYDVDCPPDDTMRLRLALNAGEVADNGTGDAVSLACELVGSGVLARVLRASDNAFAAAVATDDGIDAEAGGGRMFRGFEAVEDAGGGRLWIRVPGRPRPPGLTAGDRVPPPRAPEPELSAGGVVINNLGDHSIRIARNQGVVFGGGNSGGSQTNAPTRDSRKGRP